MAVHSIDDDISEDPDFHLAAVVHDLVHDSINYRDGELLEYRMEAEEHYNGIITKLPANEGRSKFVSNDLRAIIKKVMPSITRTLLQGQKIVEYKPQGPEDVKHARQATTYVNKVVIKESGGREAVKSAILDSLKFRNGVLKAWFEDVVKTKITWHTGLTERQAEILAGTDGVEVLEEEQYIEMIEFPNDTPDLPPQESQVQLWNLRIRRQEVQGRVMAGAIAPDNFLIHPSTRVFNKAPLIGEFEMISRSNLVEMGFDKERIYAMSASGEENSQDEIREARGDDVDDVNSNFAPELEELDYYELYVRVDYDGDGIAETRRVILIGGFAVENIFLNEEWECHPYSDIKAELRPHEWEGVSMHDDTKDIQTIKTVLTRQVLDNVYWQNNQQQIFQEGAVRNEDAITDPQYGKPIKVRQGVSVRDAVGAVEVPFIAKEAFEMLGHFDNVIKDRTGITEASGGLAPDALQNVTAKATGLIESAGIAQAGDIVLTLATGGLQKFFKDILRLVIQHQDIKRTVRIENDWVAYDPRAWNSEMDVEVNIGMGTGTRERDLEAVGQVMGLQKEILANMGADNPFVSSEEISNAIEKMVEAIGLPSAEPFFKRPDPEEVKRRMEEKAKQPTPEMMKIQASIKLEEMKAEAQIKREQAQLEADLLVAREKMQIDKELAETDNLYKKAMNDTKAEVDRDRLIEQTRIKEQELAQKERELDLREKEIKVTKAIELVKLDLEQNEDGEIQDRAYPEIDRLRELVEGVSGDLNKSRRLVYDAQGRVVGTTVSDDGTLDQEIIYDSEGNPQEIRPFN